MEWHSTYISKEREKTDERTVAWRSLRTFCEVSLQETIWKVKSIINKFIQKIHADNQELLAEKKLFIST